MAFDLALQVQPLGIYLQPTGKTYDGGTGNDTLLLRGATLPAGVNLIDIDTIVYG